MNCKRTISQVLHLLGYVTSASAWRARRLKVGRILMFHGVGDEHYPAEEFEAHLLYLQRYFDIVSLEEFERRLDGAGAELANVTVLTFDDGLRNHFTVAYPILQRLKLPATFFVCPGLIESQRWLWNHEARARFGTMGRARLAQFAFRWHLSAAESSEQLVEGMKTLPLPQRQELEQALRELTPDFEPSPQQRVACDIMSWDQVCSMDRELITIGSHTVGHPILPTLPPDQLRFEIAESRRLLEDRLGREVKHFCYPNGAFNSAVVELTRQVYTAAVTTEHGFATFTSGRHTLPRISSAETLPLLAWRMHRPGA